MTLAWLNGALEPLDQVRIGPTDRGFLLGDGLFETLRAEHGAPLHAHRHLARLRAGAAVLALPLPWPDDVLIDAMAAVLATCAHNEAALRLTLTRGPAARGVLPPEFHGVAPLAEVSILLPHSFQDVVNPGESRFTKPNG